jgi:hypothetical protein
MDTKLADAFAGLTSPGLPSARRALPNRVGGYRESSRHAADVVMKAPLEPETDIASA